MGRPLPRPVAADDEALVAVDRVDEAETFLSGHDERRRQCVSEA
jgi:hypothetical protein